jgi:Aspartyl/Asparaginyl beta-hydroxylase
MLTKKLDRVPDELFQPVYEELIKTDWNGILTGKIPKWHGFRFIKKEEKKSTGKKYEHPMQKVVGFWLRIPITGPDKLYTENDPLLDDRSLNPDYIWNQLEYVDAPEGISLAVQKCADWIYNLVGGKKLGRITVHNVSAEGMISRHSDSGQYFKYYHRFHLPILTNPNAIFTNDHGVEEHMESQFIYLLNITDPHAVYNRGETDRIHMLLDIALDHPNQSF